MRTVSVISPSRYRNLAAVLLLGLSLGINTPRVEATQLETYVEASGDSDSAAPSYQLSSSVGESSIGRASGPGNILTLSFLAQLSDLSPPQGMIIINEGAAYTTTPGVTLQLSATDDSGTVSQIRCSNDGVAYTPPEPYAPVVKWTLPIGDGTKKVIVIFSDPSGNWSAPTSDAITLDTLSPIPTITFPRDGQVFGAGL